MSIWAREDLTDADVGALKRERVSIGISTHDRAELNRALASKPTILR